jgi:hypothetical protein
MGSVKAAHPQAQGVLGIPEAIWQELWDEVESLKRLYEEARGVEGPLPPALEEALLHSLTHLWGHAKAMWEEAVLEEDE